MSRTEGNKKKNTFMMDIYDEILQSRTCQILDSTKMKAMLFINLMSNDIRYLFNKNNCLINNSNSDSFICQT